MSQTYRELLGSDLLGDSYGYLNGSTRANRTLFSGATAPTAPEPYQLWADTTAGLLKMRTGANDGWITLGTLGSAFLGLLSRAGGVMTGAIDMGGFSITNLALGSGAAAARQQELDLKAPLAAPAFTGDAQVNQDPAGNNSLIRRIWADGRYLKLTGGTLTAALNLFGNAVGELQAVPLQQLRFFLGFDVSSGHRHNGTDARKVLGTSLDAAGSSSGQGLLSTGPGTPPAWTTLPVYPPVLAWGSVNGNATILGAGSGNWSVVDQGIGVYDINVSAGVLPANPAITATPNETLAGPTRIHVVAIKQSADVVRVSTTNLSTGAAIDAKFSFAFH